MQVSHAGENEKNCKRKSKLFFKNGEQIVCSQNEGIQKNVEVAKDGIWTVHFDNLSSGKWEQYNIINEVPGPSSFAIKNVMLGSLLSVWRLFINEKIFRFIKMCTKAKADNFF